MKYCLDCERVHDDSVTKCGCDKYYPRGFTNLETKKEKIECNKCGSTEHLIYSKPWTSGRYEYGDHFTCKVCQDKAHREYERQQAMNYLVIDNNGEITYCDDEDEAEKEIKEMLEESYDEGDTGIVVLKIEERKEIKAKDFKDSNINIVIYNDTVYNVEQANDVTLTFEGDKVISWD